MSKCNDIITNIDDTVDTLSEKLFSNRGDTQIIRHELLKLKIEVFISLDWDSIYKPMITVLHENFQDHSMDMYLEDWERV